MTLFIVGGIYTLVVFSIGWSFGTHQNLQKEDD